MEQWRPVVGFETNYEVSDQGRVRSVARLDSRGHTRGGHEMKLRVCPRHGYVTVKLMQHGKSRLCKVHRLVLEAFDRVGAKDEVCRHLNDIKTDNSIGNLAWGSQRENKQDAMRNGRVAIGERNGGGGKLTENDVRFIRGQVRLGVTPTNIAKQVGVSACTICDIKAGRAWAHVV